MERPGEDRNHPLYRPGVPVPLSELRRVDELARMAERATAAGDGGIISQQGANGLAVGFNTSPGYVGFAARIIKQDAFNPWMYSFEALIEQGDPNNGEPNPIWLTDLNYFNYGPDVFNGMEGNYRHDVPLDPFPSLVLSQPAVKTLPGDIISFGPGMKPSGVFGDTTAGSTLVKNLSSIDGILPGESVTDGTSGGIPADTTVERVIQHGAIVWMTPSAYPDFFTFYYFERVMIIEITGPFDPTTGYYPAIEKIFHTASQTWINGNVCYWRDANA